MCVCAVCEPRRVYISKKLPHYLIFTHPQCPRRCPIFNRQRRCHITANTTRSLNWPHHTTSLRPARRSTSVHPATMKLSLAFSFAACAVTLVAAWSKEGTALSPQSHIPIPPPKKTPANSPFRPRNLPPPRRNRPLRRPRSNLLRLPQPQAKRQPRRNHKSLQEALPRPAPGQGKAKIHRLPHQIHRRLQETRRPPLKRRNQRRRQSRLGPLRPPRSRAETPQGPRAQTL